MNFCTLFDSYYLYKGIALYLSLERVTKDFRLYVMAFDKTCYEKLKSMRFKFMVVELLDDFETPELLAVKQTRTKAEYCWTCGPSVIQHFLHKYSLDCITYIDSDLFFLSDPHLSVDEYKSSSIAITEQGISDGNAKIYGKYCVQYMYFRNDQEGNDALSWWKDSCIEWCYQKVEPTRYGDQKYLDEFPRKWRNVCVIQNLGLGIAPWNMHRYAYNEDTFVHKGKKFQCVFFHMHGVQIKLIDNILHVHSLHHELNNTLISKFYQPYANLLKEVVQYLGYEVSCAIVHDMPWYKKIEYRFRNIIRRSQFIRWIWFSLFKKKTQGHGSKL